MTEKELIKGLSKNDRKIYMDGQREKTLKKNNEIKKEECTGLLKVESGRLRVYLMGGNGREITLFTLIPGEVCIMSSPCSFGRGSMDVYIQAVEETTVKILSSQTVDTIKKRNPGFSTELLNLMGKRMNSVLNLMDDLMGKSVDVRIGEFLLESQGVINLSHEEVANHVGSSREVISRILKEFAREGAVSLGRKRIEVTDREKLKKIIKN